MSELIDTRLAYLRHTTRAYIQDEPTDVVLQRQVAVDTPGGGHKFPTVDVPVQTFRFVNQDITSGISSGADAGISRKFTYVMIGKHDADVKINDSWQDGDIEYKVESLIPANKWEVRAYVTAFAKEPVMG